MNHPLMAKKMTNNFFKKKNKRKLVAFQAHPPQQQPAPSIYLRLTQEKNKNYNKP